MAFKMKGFNMVSYGDSPSGTTVAEPKIKPSEVNFEVPGLAEYKKHVSNTPQFKEGGGVRGFFGTLAKRAFHNITGPSNPLMNTGGGAIDLIGGKGAYKLLSRGFAKLAAKQAVKKGVGKITN
mgnify:CR=1 FL=1